MAISTGGSGRFFINASGDVGVGTGSPLASAGFTGVTASGSTGGIFWFAKAGAQKGYIYGQDNDVTIASTDASGVIRLLTGGNTERLRIDSSGRVGIGTSSPANNLHIRGAAANAGIRLQSDGGSGETYEIRSLTSGLLTIGTTLSNILNISGTNVGIGTTSPADKLHVNGNIRITGSNPQYIQAVGIDLKLNTDSQNITFNRNGTTEMGRFDSSGRLGIGTSSPNYKLHLHSATAGDSNYLQITHADAGSGSSDGLQLGLGTGSSPIAYIAQKENAAMVFQTNATERVRIESNGKTKFSGGVYGNETTITASDFDLNDGNFFTCGAIAIPNPTNGVAGMSGLIRVTAAPTSFGSNWDFPGGSYTAPTTFPAVAPFYVVSSTQFYLGNWTEGIA